MHTENCPFRAVSNEKKKSGASDVNFSRVFCVGLSMQQNLCEIMQLLSEFLAGIGRISGMTALWRSVPSGEGIALPSLSLGFPVVNDSISKTISTLYYPGMQEEVQRDRDERNQISNGKKSESMVTLPLYKSTVSIRKHNLCRLSEDSSA